jgi:hypothetical protein
MARQSRSQFLNSTIVVCDIHTQLCVIHKAKNVSVFYLQK